ncbi:unnamed protein product [Diatraea saccharalis]|uniref:C2H2-type domain-containing protein n=1 Tax=Diatraea saccharalis TaxID=40085 RepID=A0A9N9QVU7_9NEOP|nr:unnamed protein product [Diatraea saccharalis]
MYGQFCNDIVNMNRVHSPRQYVNPQNVRFRPPFNNQRQYVYKRSPQSNCNTQYWCETCDRNFPSIDLLEKHIQQHQKCNIDGCQFVAHPKVVTKHIQMQHASGLYKKIANLNNPEDIQKWREERKKKYPTKQNVEKKTAAHKEKLDRGEKMGLKASGHYKNFKIGPKRKTISNDNNQPKRQRTNVGKKSTVNNFIKKLFHKKTVDVVPEVNSLQTLKPFSGIQGIIMECIAEEEKEEINVDIDIEDEDDIIVNNSKVDGAKLEPNVCSALSALMCDYESSDEELEKTNLETCKIIEISPKSQAHNKNVLQNKCLHKDHDSGSPEDIKVIKNFRSSEKCIDNEEKTEEVKEVKPNDTTPNMLENESFGNTENNDDNDDDGPEEIKVVKQIDTKIVEQEITVQVTNSKTKNVKTHNNNMKIKRYQYRKPKLPSTLLQKLLNREIQQERNIVLQCIRHIMKNDFFDKKIS